jgi:hypothetical protein
MALQIVRVGLPDGSAVNGGAGGGRNLVTMAEIERYRMEVLGTRGWAGRKADGGEGEPVTGAGARVRQRAYRARKRAQAGA